MGTQSRPTAVAEQSVIMKSFAAVLAFVALAAADPQILAPTGYAGLAGYAGNLGYGYAGQYAGFAGYAAAPVAAGYAAAPVAHAVAAPAVATYAAQPLAAVAAPFAGVYAGNAGLFDAP